MRLYWIDTKWACGGIWVKNKIVYEGAPIFKKFIGQSINRLKQIYQVKKLEINCNICGGKLILESQPYISIYLKDIYRCILCGRLQDLEGNSTYARQ